LPRQPQATDPLPPPRREERFINALGEGVPPAKALGKSRGKKTEKVKRTTIDPVGTTRRSTAKERKAAHEARLKKKLAAQPETAEAGMPEPPQAPFSSGPEPPVDPELAAEIEAMKADDARKGKYYHRRKTDI
jgi:hypothetical protein